MSLAPDRRARTKAIAERLTALSQEFARNLRDNTTRMPFAPADMLGLPEAYLSRQPRDEAGNYLLSFDYPDFNPFMANAESEDARRRYYVGYLNRGSARNLEILDEVVSLRRELAASSTSCRATRTSCCGAAWPRRPRPSNASLPRSRRPWTRPSAAISTSSAHSRPRAPGSLRQTSSSIAGMCRFSASGSAKKRYRVDQESLRRYFPPGPTLAWLLDVGASLYGLRFDEARVPVWHDDVRYFDVHDAETGEFIGGIYVDLYPREGKFPHAAAWPVRGVSRKAGRTPISVLVTNFDRRGLTHDEVKTLFHEFGHILHGVCRRRRSNFTPARTSSATSSRRRRRSSRSGRDGSKASSACARRRPTPRRSMPALSIGSTPRVASVRDCVRAPVALRVVRFGR